MHKGQRGTGGPEHFGPGGWINPEVLHPNALEALRAEGVFDVEPADTGAGAKSADADGFYHGRDTSAPTETKDNAGAGPWSRDYWYL